MTFEQADRLCGKIITFARSMGGPYPDMDENYLVWTILSTLGAGQFVLRIDSKGIRYFANWYKVNADDLEKVKRLETPSSICGGEFVYVAEVISRGEPGDAAHMIRRIRKMNKGHKGAFWHQAHRNSRFCTIKETAHEHGVK